MKCPVCKTSRELQIRRLEPRLGARTCPGCGGSWIRAADYWQWRAQEEQGHRLGEPQEIVAIDVDQRVAKLCPEDGSFLGLYRVGIGDSLTVDQCSQCAGVWLDAREWEILGQHGLHEHLYDLLDASWQDELRRVERREVEHDRYVRRLGADDLRRIQEIRDWLDAHPRKSELYAFLQYSTRG